MSMEAIIWAYKQELKSSPKFVLVTMANYSGETDCIFPSIQTVCNKTGLDRKTVISAISTLEKLNLIRDTGERKGATGQIKVYQLQMEPSQNRDDYVSGTVPKLQETVPFFPDNSSENGTQNHKRNKRSETKDIESEFISLWQFPGMREIWEEFKAYRKQIRKTLTPRAIRATLIMLSQRPESAVKAMEIVLEKGWQNFKWSWIDNESKTFRYPGPKFSPHGEKPQGYSIDEQLQGMEERNQAEQGLF